MENGPSSSPKGGQGKRGSDNSSLSQFMGKSWTTWQDYASAAESKGSKEEETPTPLPKGSSMKLRVEDMPLFGLCPSQDEFYLVVCEHCDIVIKPQALRSHIETRHPHSLEHRWSDSPTPTSVAGSSSAGVSGDGATNRLSANPSPTQAVGSTSSSSVSAGGPSSRSTPSPSRSSSAGSSKKAREPKKKGLGKRSKGKQKVPMVLVDRMPSPLPMPVVVPGPRDEEAVAVPEAENPADVGASSDVDAVAASSTTPLRGAASIELISIKESLSEVVNKGSPSISKIRYVEEEKQRKEESCSSHRLPSKEIVVIAQSAELEELKSTKQKSNNSPSSRAASSPKWINSGKSRHLLPPSATPVVQTSQSLPDLSAPARLDSSPGVIAAHYPQSTSPLPQPSGNFSHPSSPHRSPLVGVSPTHPPLPPPRPPPTTGNLSNMSKSSPLPSGETATSSAFEIIAPSSPVSPPNNSRSTNSVTPPSRRRDENEPPVSATTSEKDSAATPPVIVPVSPPPHSLSSTPPSKSKNTFLPVNNEVSKNNMSVALTLARMSVEMKAAGVIPSSASSSSSHSPPTVSRPTPSLSSPDKRILLVSPANLINSVRRKGVEAAKSRLNLENNSTSRWSPLKANNAPAGGSQQSFAPLIEEPFTNNPTPTPWDPHQFSPQRTDRTSSASTGSHFFNSDGLSDRETDAALQSIMEDLNPRSLIVSPTHVLQSQTPMQQQQLISHESMGPSSSYVRVPSTSSSEDVGEFLDPNIVTNQRNHYVSPTLCGEGGNKKKSKGSGTHGEKIVLCKDRTYDPDRHCGVSDDGNKFTPCTRSLTCKSHNLSARRNVTGRSKAFDALLAEHKAAKEAKLRELGKLKKSPLPSPSSSFVGCANTSPSLSSSVSSSPQMPPSPKAVPITTPTFGTPAFDQLPPTTASLVPPPSAVVHYPGGQSSGLFLVPPPLIVSTPSSLSSPFSKSSRVSVVRTPFAPLPRSFETLTIPSGSPNRNHVATVPRPPYLPLSEAGTGDGEHTRGLRVPRGTWPTSSQPPQAVAMCSFGARATPSALPSSCSSGSCMLLGRRMDLFRSAFKAAVDSHLNPPPVKKTCASSAPTLILGEQNTLSDVVSNHPPRTIDMTSFGNNSLTQSSAYSNLATQNCAQPQLLLQQSRLQQQQSAVGGKADVNANLNGALGVRFSGVSVDVGPPSSGSQLQLNAVTQEGQSTSTLMSPPSRQPFSSSSFLKSSPTSAVKRKRSSSSFANRSDDSDSSSSSYCTAGNVASGLSGSESALPSSSPQQFGCSNQAFLQQQQQLLQPSSNTQSAVMLQRQSENAVGVNSLSISLPLTVQSQVLTSGSSTTSSPAFRQLTELQQQQQRQMISSSNTALGMEQVVVSNPSGQFQGGHLQGQGSGLRNPANSGTIYLSSGTSGINASSMQQPPQPPQPLQQQQPRFTRANSNLIATSTNRTGMISGQVPLLRPPTKIDSNSISMSGLSNRNVKNVQHNLPAQASRVMSSANAHARRLMMNNASLPATPQSGVSRTSSIDGSQPAPFQNSSIDVSSSNMNDHAGSSRLGAASHSPQFAVPNSSHHKDARVSSSPLRGHPSSAPTIPSSQVLSTSMTQSLHLPNGLRTLPPGYPARSALLGNDRTRGSVTMVGTANGQEAVGAATHMLGSSGSHVASKHLSSSS